MAVADLGKRGKNAGVRTGWVLTLLATILGPVAVYLVHLAPTEATMGVVQKIFYFHVASAMNMMLAFGICGIASIGYFLTRRGAGNWSERFDAIGASSAEIGVTLGLIVLTTGPLWAKEAWGTWWTWEPRLTLSMLVEFLFLAYLALRSFSGNDEMGRSVSSGLAVLGLPSLYFIHVAVERWGGAHPQVVFSGGLHVLGMRLALWTSVLSVLLLGSAIVVLRASTILATRRVDRAFLDIDRMDKMAG